MTAPTITRIADVLAALKTLAEAATAGVVGFEVLDGPRLGELPWKHLMLGITDTPDTPPYTTHYSRQEGFGRPRYVEEFTIRCGLTVADGSGNLAGVRAEVVSILGLLDVALRDAHTDSGTWDQIGIGEADMTWYPVPNQDGSTVLVFFSIEGSSLL